MGAGGPSPRTFLSRHNSAQSQLARVSPLGLVTLVPPPERPKPACQSVRGAANAVGKKRACAVEEVTGPHARSPASTGNRQRAPAACTNDRRLGEGECPTPDTPHGGRSPRRPGRPCTAPTELKASSHERAL